MMLRILAHRQRACSRATRRDVIRAAGADTRIHDPLGRPVSVMEGSQPMTELFS